MRSARRLIAALAVALLCAPGTWLRTEVPQAMPEVVTLEKVAGESATPSPAWRIGGVWSYSADSRYFGGFSALLALSDHHLRAFSDRGARFTFLEPDQPGAATALTSVNYQIVIDRLAHDLWDIEAATRDPASANYWLAYENHHAIHRFTVASEVDGVRELVEEVDWPVNSGAEAMLRLGDGRFLVMPEGQHEVALFAGDPVDGGDLATFAWRNPAPSFVVTDLAQLPDGRILLLMRNLEWGMPPFASAIALAHPPDPAAKEPWSPKIALRFDGVIPRENYEGMAVREREDGLIDVWVIADDNISVFQRNLLVKLVLEPAEL